MKRETLLTVIVVDFLNGEVLETEAIVDSGSALSFLSLVAVQKCAPDLLDKVGHYHTRVHGVTGAAVKVVGAIELPCEVAERAVLHEFVIADIVEPVLLGVDFLRRHQATWDWLIGKT